MKIEVEVPDWAGEHCIRIISNVELVAYKHTGQNWQVKEVRCNRCGVCCGAVEGYKTCEHFETTPGNGHCKLGLSMPFHCVAEALQKDYPKCCVTYREQK